VAGYKGTHKPPVRYGADHHRWQGDEATYTAAHIRLRRARGKSGRCVFGCPDELTNWANLTGNLLDFSDYAPMCPTCHTRYDTARKSMEEGFAGHHRTDPRTKLTADLVMRLRRRRSEGATLAVLAAEFGISRSHAGGIAAGTAWRWI
jgi:hypothetical protein